MTVPRRSVISLGLGVPGWIFVIFLLLGAVLIAVAVPITLRGWRLDSAGVDAMGQVTGLDSWEESCGRNNMDRCMRYQVSYRFAAGAIQQAGKAQVSAQDWGALTVGAPLAVRYLPTDPTQNELSAGETLIEGGALGLIGLGFAGGFGAAWAFRLRKAARLVRVRDQGTQRAAEVIQRRETSVSINRRKQWVIRWRDSAGVEGESRLHRPEDLPAMGASVTIYADPDGVLPPAWEGDVGSR